MSTRDQLRTIGLKGVTKKRAKFSYQGTEFEIVEPTVGEFTKIIEKSANNIEVSVWAMILLTVVPGTEERVFEPADYATFMGQSLDGLMLAAKSAITEVMNKEDEKKDIAALSNLEN